MIYPHIGSVGQYVRLVGMWVAFVLLLGGCTGTENYDGVTMTPVDSLLYFSFKDTGGNLYLSMRSDYLYGTGNVEIASEIGQVSEDEIIVDVQGIRIPNSGPAVMGHATVNLPLPDITGVFTLTMIYADIDADTYTLSVSESDISVSLPSPPLFTYPERTEWKRLPRSAIWMIIHNPGQSGPYPQHFFPEPETYNRQVSQFSDDLKNLGVENYVPEPGCYTNPMFIPPSNVWPNPEIEKLCDGVISTLPYHMPYVRYFLYDGDWNHIVALIDSYQDSDLGIAAYNWAGDVYFTRTKPEVTATPFPTPIPTPVPSILSTPSPLATPVPSDGSGD